MCGLVRKLEANRGGSGDDVWVCEFLREGFSNWGRICSIWRSDSAGLKFEISDHAPLSSNDRLDSSF